MHIDREFKDLIPPLSDEELRQLEENIKLEGCRDPLVIWQGILIDGHNRYDICTRNNIEFDTTDIELDDREAVKDWIDKNQLGRRNLTPDWFRYLTGRRYERTKTVGHGKKSADQIDTQMQTADRIAKDHGVAPATVKRAGKFTQQVDEHPELKQALIDRKPINKVLKTIEYGHDQGDEWYTPQWLFDALGLQFDVDVCAPRDLTHVTTPADRYFNEDDDGLEKEWSGVIWCNPPYSAPEPWADKCIEHGNGLLLTHIPMNAAWAQRVWTACDGIRLFQAIEFTRPDGKTQRPGSWLQLAAFGQTAKEALKNLTVPDEVAENPRRVPSPMWIKE